MSIQNTTSLGLLIGLSLGALLIIITFGPRTIRFFRTDPGFRTWLSTRSKRIVRHLPTWQEIAMMLVIYALGYLASHLINSSY